MTLIKEINRAIIKYTFNSESNRKVAMLLFIALDFLGYQRILTKKFNFFSVNEREFLSEKFGKLGKTLPFISNYKNIKENKQTKINEITLMVAYTLLRCGDEYNFEKWLEENINNIWIYICNPESLNIYHEILSTKKMIDKLIFYIDKNKLDRELIVNLQVNVEILERNYDYKKIKKLYLENNLKPSFILLRSLALSHDATITDMFVHKEIKDKERLQFLRFLTAQVELGSIRESYAFEFAIWLNASYHFSYQIKSEAIDIICKKLLLENKNFSAYTVGYLFTKKYPYNERLNLSFAGAAFLLGGEKKVVQQLKPILEEAKQTDYFLWRMTITLSTLISHEFLKLLISDRLRERIRKYSEKYDLNFFFNILFENNTNGILGIDQRSKYGYTVFPMVGNENSKNDFYFCSIKNINYAYILSSSYDSYENSSGVICDERFLSLFENSFPTLKFYGVKRPIDLPENLPKWYGSEFKNFIIDYYNRFYSQKLSIQSIIKNRKKGWLKPLGDNLLLNDHDCDIIKIGISVGTGNQIGLRGLNNIPYSVFSELILLPNIEFYNLDYFADESKLQELGIKSLPFDLKNDMALFGKLVSELDLVICIPNNIMDAAAAYGTPAYVFDPLKRFSYWGQDRGCLYFFSDVVEFVSGENHSETLNNLKVKVKSFINKNHDN
ncbi:TPA: hypothetical protein KD862_002837 [Vibrio cholerae]|nr:hypothetical protein [Vibrio cholerae]